jgi:chemotaxis protein MotB
VATKSKCPEQEVCEEPDEMMATFADMMSLLMAFFIMLLATAHWDPIRYGEVSEGMKDAFARVVTTSIQEELVMISPTPEEKAEEEKDKDKKESATEKAVKSVENMVENRGIEEFVKMKKIPGGFELELANSSLFTSGSATLQRTIKPVLTQLAKKISSIKGAQMEIQGHTDDDPIHTVKFPSNWELSSSRAINVLRFMTSHGMDAQRVNAVAYADTVPKAPNRDAAGRAIKKNQADNRRVIIKVTQEVKFEDPEGEVPAWKKRIKVQGGKRVKSGKRVDNKKKRKKKKKKNKKDIKNKNR